MQSVFYGFAVQHSLLQVIALVGQFQGEEGDVFIEEFKEDFVAFPHGEIEEALFVDPFEVAFVADDLFAFPFGADEEVHLFGGPDVMYEGDDAAVAPFGDFEAGLFADLAQHAFLGALPHLELTSHAKPFVVVEVIFFFGAMQHQVLAAAFQVTEGGLFHF